MGSLLGVDADAAVVVTKDDQFGASYRKARVSTGDYPSERCDIAVFNVDLTLRTAQTIIVYNPGPGTPFKPPAALTNPARA